MSEHAGYHSRENHVDLLYHFVQDAIQDVVIKMQYVPTAKQLADFMTKSLPTPQFTKLVKISDILENTEISN